MDFTGGVAAAGLGTGTGFAGALAWTDFLTADFAFALAGATGAALVFAVAALPAGTGLTGAGLALMEVTLAGAGLAFPDAAVLAEAGLIFAVATGFVLAALPAGAGLALGTALTGTALAGVALAFAGAAAADFFAGVLVAVAAFAAGLGFATGFLALFVAGLLACFLAAVATIEPSV